MQSVKTLWALELAAGSKPGNVYVPSDFSTINGGMEIAENQALAQDEFPEPGLLVIGNGGHENDGVRHNIRKKHKATNALLFNHLPFIGRPLTNRLDPEEAKNYRLRKVINVGGTDYEFWFAMVLPRVTTSRETKVIDLTQTPHGEADYTPTAAQYSPTPVTSTAGIQNTAPTKLLRVRDFFEINISIAQISEIINACKVLYGDERDAIISEWAIASQFDRDINNTDGGVSVDYTEAISSQILSFLASDRIELQYAQKEVEGTVGIGNSIPLYD